MKLPLADIGTESEKGIVAAFDDLFGPSFREVGEYLADKVRYHRLKSLQKIIRKAKNFGPDGVAFVSPPPMKFLVPFMEAASLEEEADDVMADLWAKLLAQAATEYDVQQIHFIRILKEISGREARLLNEIAVRFRGDVNERGVYSDEYTVSKTFLTRAGVSSYFDKALEEVPLEDIGPGLIRKFESSGCHIHHIDVATRVDGPMWTSVEDGISGWRTPLYTDFGSITFDLLRASSLIEEVRIEIIERDTVGIELDAWVFTGLGAAFYRGCAKDVFERLS